MLRAVDVLSNVDSIHIDVGAQRIPTSKTVGVQAEVKPPARRFLRAAIVPEAGILDLLTIWNIKLYFAITGFGHESSH